MSINLIGCIIRRHGKDNVKGVLHSVFRQYGNGANKVQKKKAKLLASPSTATCVAKKVKKDESTKDKEEIPSVIGRVTYVGSVPEFLDRPIKLGSEKHTQVNSSSSVQYPEGPLIGVPSAKNVILPKDLYLQWGKAVIDVEPIIEKKLPEVESSAEKKSETDRKDTVNLINVVRPVDLEWHKQVIDPRMLLRYYMSLSKIRLTGLVVLTTAAGYGMAYAPVQPVTLIYTLLGTALMSASANSINQFLEIPYDSQMVRTKKRVLVKGFLTSFHAASFAACTSALGLSMLYFGVNGLTAGLGATNLLLYTCIYTPLKRCSILNTWVGSVVGAIPPLMGWAACAGSLDASALLMGAILYSWQFPHFNALSWNLRHDYSRAGYRMMSVVNPDLCRRTALRHSIAIFVFCNIAPLIDLTTWSFAVDSFLLNSYFVYCSWKFYKNPDSQSSRKLFRLSLIHLPALMILMIIAKRYATPSTVDVMSL